MRFIQLFWFKIILIFASLNCTAQAKSDSLLRNILFNTHFTLLQEVLNHPDSFRVQIIYTQINRDRHNKPQFKNYYFNLDTNLYFNPASTVKLPLALLALEKLNNLKIKGVNKYTTIQIDSNYHWQTAEYSDSTSQTGLPSISHYIKKIFLVSDNDAYNRLYQFVGQETIHRKLREKGYPDIRFPRQFLGLTDQRNRHTNSIRFINKEGKLIYAQPPAYNQDSFHWNRIIKIGSKHINNQDSLIYEPFDFTRLNNLPLEDLQQILQSVLFPESVPAYQRFNLTKNDYRFLYQYLSQYPAETNFPKYDSTEYYDSYVKNYFTHDNHRIPSYIRVFNKVGWAYGFLIDASYIVDFKNKVEYMLTSIVYVNSDGIVNDDTYEYDQIGLPFLNQLGQTIYQYELTRARKYKPNLKKFKIKYEQRDMKDTRPTIKTVDN